MNDGIIKDSVEIILGELSKMELTKKVLILNEIRRTIAKQSPFINEPVDCVEWVPVDNVKANDYNPNSVAPPEMELLRHSINHDGYTQPVVTWSNEEGIEVIDGFHRTRVCKELKDVHDRVYGFLPVVTIKTECSDKKDRIASTIRHNRARGKHKVTAMSDIVIELKNRNWKNSRISRELGMDEDEVLRLCQITGLEELFKDGQFSKSWEVGHTDDDYEILTDSFEYDEDHIRTVNTSDPNRIFHTFDKWECNKAGFYESKKEGMTKEQCENEFADYLSDLQKFRHGLERVTSEWKNSCEHYLTNTAMNRIAWLGQASVCCDTGIPSKFCGGWSQLSEEEQDAANNLALEYLNKWLVSNNIDPVDMNAALSAGRQVSIY